MAADLSLPCMQLRRFMGVIAAFTIVMVVGLFAAAPASAHSGHSHGLPPDQAIHVSVDPEVALALAELAGETSSTRDDAIPAKDGRPDRQPPCDGHCCTIGGMTCCSFIPASLQSITLASIIDVGLPGPADIRMDGLVPDSLLRPPRSFA